MSSGSGSARLMGRGASRAQRRRDGSSGGQERKKRRKHSLGVKSCAQWLDYKGREKRRRMR